MLAFVLGMFVLVFAAVTYETLATLRAREEEDRWCTVSMEPLDDQSRLFMASNVA